MPALGTPHPNNQAGLDGPALRALLAASCRALEANRDTINALNVFPVPDGDTGTNMLLTVRQVLDQTRNGLAESAGEASRAMARAALLGARGNSGLILAQYFKGMSTALDGSSVMGSAEFARGMRAAAQAAYSSVPEPREGTMLTVLRECADCAEKCASGSPTLTGMFDLTAAQALDCVARTPAMLDVLRRAGVVDSGGFGFAVMLQGALVSLKGEGDGGVVVAAPAPQLNDHGANGNIQEFASTVTEEDWGYCTSFAVQGHRFDVDRLRKEVSTFGRSAVVAGDSTAVRVHVHVEDPGPILSFGVTLGTLSGVEVKDMDAQARSWAAARGAEGTPLQAAGAVSVIAVVSGDGMAGLFQSVGLGACAVIQGGDSMNPSTGEILAAVEDSPSGNIVILPNNANVIGTARQVGALTKKRVAVVPVKSMQAGLAALLALSPEAGLDENAAEMERAAGQVRAGAVCRASRDTHAAGSAVSRGQFIGLLDDEVLASASDAGETLEALLSGRVPEGAIVTVFRGQAAPEAQADEMLARLRRLVPHAEFQAQDGGQPHYEYLISIE